MNETEQIRVTIPNPDMEVSDAEHAHSTLSTIREHNNPISPELSFGNDHPRYIKNSNCLKSDEFYHISDKKAHSSEPFDIDLLLRYYACNSSMEKSINKMFETKVDKNCLHDPCSSQLCKDTDRGPLIELGAVNRVFNLLHRETFENVFLFRDTITKLQSLLSRYSSNELQQILSSDSSIKVCQHCGVISCSKSKSESVESRQSPPRTSYFLNTQIFSNENTDSKAHRTIQKFYTKKQQKRFGKYGDSQKSSTWKRYDDNKKNSMLTDSPNKPDGKVSGSTGQRVEILISENGVETENTLVVQSVLSEQVSERNKTTNKKDLQSCINVFQATEPMFVKGEKIALPRCSDKDCSEIEKMQEVESNKNCAKIIGVADDLKDSQNSKPLKLAEHNDVLSFVDSNLLRQKEIRQKSPIGSQGSMNKTNEKVMKDILYEKSKVDGSEIPQLTSMQDVMNHCNIDSELCINSIIDTMAYLAGSRFDSDKKQDEFVVQYNDRSWVQSRDGSNNRHCFILHAARDGDPQLDCAINMYSESKHPDRTSGKNKFGTTNNTRRSNVQSASLACVMEDDSLENCTKANLNSDHSGSSSSAENMIREWMNCSHKGDRSGVNSRDITVSSSPVIIGLDVKLQTPGINDKCVCCTEKSIDMHRDLEVKHSNEKKDSFLSSNDQGRTRTSGENSKVENSQESVSSDAKKKKKCEQVESSGTKKFGIKRFLESLKSIKSGRSMKFKQSKSSMSSNKKFSHSSVSRKVTRRIRYNESSLKSLTDNDKGHGEVANTLTVYRKILEDTKEMDWDSFRRFIGKLHASQKELWHDICDAIDKEAKRLADKSDGVTEVCIEISSVPGKGTKHAERSCSNEIVFEMDMTLRDVEGFLDSELAAAEKRQLDTLWRASEVIRVRNDDVCNTEVASNQAE